LNISHDIGICIVNKKPMPKQALAFSTNKPFIVIPLNVAWCTSEKQKPFKNY